MVYRSSLTECTIIANTRGDCGPNPIQQQQQQCQWAMSCILQWGSIMESSSKFFFFLSQDCVTAVSDLENWVELGSKAWAIKTRSI